MTLISSTKSLVNFWFARIFGRLDRPAMPDFPSFLTRSIHLYNVDLGIPHLRAALLTDPSSSSHLIHVSGALSVLLFEFIITDNPIVGFTKALSTNSSFQFQEDFHSPLWIKHTVPHSSIEHFIRG